MKRKVLLFLIATIVFVCACSLSGCSSDKKTYEEAYMLAAEHHFAEARELFSQLPDEYAPDMSSPDAATWIASIDRYVNSPFIGRWKNGKYLIEITLEVDGYSGVYLEYEKEYTSPGGVYMRDVGCVGIEEDGKTAYYYRASKSNAENYTLVLTNNSTMEIWFDGLNGNECEIVLDKR